MHFALLLAFKFELLWLYFGKFCKTRLSKKPKKPLRTCQHSYQHSHPLRNDGPLKIWKNCFFWRLLFQKRNSWHLKFWYWKTWGIWVNYCWNHGPSKLLLHFIEYHLDQLNSKHTKATLNSTIQYFEGCFQKECLLKVWNFLIFPPQNGSPLKFLRNCTETIV